MEAHCLFFTVGKKVEGKGEKLLEEFHSAISKKAWEFLRKSTSGDGRGKREHQWRNEGHFTHITKKTFSHLSPVVLDSCCML